MNNLSPSLHNTSQTIGATRELADVSEQGLNSCGASGSSMRDVTAFGTAHLIVQPGLGAPVPQLSAQPCPQLGFKAAAAFTLAALPLGTKRWALGFEDRLLKLSLMIQAG